MKNNRKCSIVPVLAAVVLLLLGGCGKDEVSYSVDEEAQAVSESAADSQGEGEGSESETISGSAHGGAGQNTDSAEKDQAEDSVDAGTSGASGVSGQSSGSVDSGQSPSAGEGSPPSSGSGALDVSGDGAAAAVIQVYVCGAVVSPGVYTLPEGSRVYEAVAMAGGLLETAEPRALNQARLLSDGEQITVLTVEEAESGEGLLPEGSEGASDGGASFGETADSSGGKVNLNTADEAGLMTIPGIGESRAKAIIAYREKNGKFQSIEEIMEIDGIKEKMFEKIKDSITV